ncbi:hypothetical protein BDV38DRAFT_279077 [Aspergillus pseudotamarii]|uniref:NAD(P)-binding protein n=1 Tax=Aspergillus pseudotamarii TaxID=132259 RepID=A0A5N6T613_ASPPS|nr:uncharacterized protein BDV38DRAFT_279077 [Aspergillus pseudotamarii]KAE8141730.1 hypothetical protein BDV38DRAFT_279077 [Aspergillus pseudotamarii]
MDTKAWLVVGASRGIGLEFVRLILASGHRVVATARGSGSALDAIARDAPDRSFIDQFVQSGVKKIDYAVINAGILEYPNRALDMTFDQFAQHLLTNAVGPVIVAQERLKLPDVSIETIAFMSSDSGSTQRFLAFEDGFAAYGVSKAALNQALRHLAEELRRKQRHTVILASRPSS